MMETGAIAGLLIVGFMIGRAVQKWADGTMEAEEGAYRVGYDEGYKEGQNDMHRRQRRE